MELGQTVTIALLGPKSPQLVRISVSKPKMVNTFGPIPNQAKIKSRNVFTDKVTSSYHLCVEYFSQLSFDSEVYTKSATAADFVYTSESNESCEKHSTQR